MGLPPRRPRGGAVHARGRAHRDGRRSQLEGQAHHEVRPGLDVVRGVGDDGGARRRGASRGPAREGHRAEGQGSRGREGHLVARGRRRRDRGEDAGRHDPHRRGCTALARSAPGGLEAADPTVRGLPRTEPRGGGRRRRSGRCVDPVGGIRLGLSATWSVLMSFFRRLFGGSKTRHA